MQIKTPMSINSCLLGWLVTKRQDNKCLRRIWKKGDPCTLVEISTAIMENSMEIPQRSKN
jgi:hypothetical protein